MSSAREHRELRDAIRVELGREPDLVLWVNEGGMATYGRARVKYGLCDGSADLIGIGPGGQFVAWEVKTGKATLEPAQKRFLQLVETRSGAVAVVRSVDDAWAALASMRQAAK